MSGAEKNGMGGLKITGERGQALSSYFEFYRRAVKASLKFSGSHLTR
jgi:hypothetical protein